MWAPVVAACRLESTGSVVVAPWLSCPQHVQPSGTKDQTHVPCTGRPILIHHATREVFFYLFLRTILEKALVIYSLILEK